MEPNSDKEMQELMEEIAEDLGYSSKNQEEGMPLKSRKKRGKMGTLVFGGAGILLLILLSTRLFGGRDGQTGNEGSSVLAGRLDRIESRLSQLDGTMEKIAYLEQQGEGINRSTMEAEASTRALKERLDLISQKTDRLEQSLASLSAALNASSPRPTLKASKGAAVSRTSKRYHEVSRGDTLYSIARRYGTSVDEIRRINHLAKAETIRPGQKLLVE